MTLQNDKFFITIKLPNVIIISDWNKSFFFLKLPQAELTKSMQTRTGNERIPDTEILGGLFRRCFDLMCDSKPFGRLLHESEYSSLEHDDFSIQYLLWAAMLKDVPLFEKEYFFYAPYSNMQLCANTGDIDNDSSEDTAKKVKIDPKTPRKTITMEAMMGSTSSEQKSKKTPIVSSKDGKNSFHMKSVSDSDAESSDEESNNGECYMQENVSNQKLKSSSSTKTAKNDGNVKRPSENEKAKGKETDVTADEKRKVSVEKVTNANTDISTSTKQRIDSGEATGIGNFNN